MTQIHLHAEPGDYAAGDAAARRPEPRDADGRTLRRRARRRRRLVNANRGLLGYTGTVDGVPVSVQTTMMGTPTTSIVMEELHEPRRDDVHPRRDVRRLRRPRHRRRGGRAGRGIAGPASAASSAAASRPHRPPTSTSSTPWRPPAASRDSRPTSGRSSPPTCSTTRIPTASSAGAGAATSRRRWRRRRCTCWRCASGPRAGRCEPGRS